MPLTMLPDLNASFPSRAIFVATILSRFSSGDTTSSPTAYLLPLSLLLWFFSDSHQYRHKSHQSNPRKVHLYRYSSSYPPKSTFHSSSLYTLSTCKILGRADFPGPKLYLPCRTLCTIRYLHPSVCFQGSGSAGETLSSGGRRQSGTSLTLRSTDTFQNRRVPGQVSILWTRGKSISARQPQSFLDRFRWLICLNLQRRQQGQKWRQ